MKLMDLKDKLPADFTPIQETMDTHEPVLRNKRLCVKLAPQHSAEAAICDVQLQHRSKHISSHYSFIGEVNSMGIWYRVANLPKILDPLKDKTSPAPGQPGQISTTPVLGAPRRNATRPDSEHQISGLNIMSGMDDIPFVISEQFAKKLGDTQRVNLMGITIKSLAEIEEEYTYTFNTEYSTATYLTEAPTCP
uniref:Multivesicular body subunit 12B n=2 Tax=Denticeps clupeoides TaxID=299321 RepID=A0AAY4EUR4_9TELE